MYDPISSIFSTHFPTILQQLSTTGCMEMTISLKSEGPCVYRLISIKYNYSGVSVFTTGTCTSIYITYRIALIFYREASRSISGENGDEYEKKYMS